MKYKLTALMVLAVLLVGCSKEEFPGAEQQGMQLAGDVIKLGVKEVVAPVTKAQHTGSMNFTQLESTGFGVYGYEGSSAYNSSSSEFNLFTPNTHVTFVSGGTAPTTIVDHPGSWEYTGDLKEWDSTKKYTFFAYAPYMSAGEGTAGTDAGINTISTGAGDPKITYTVATDPAQSVDLLWGVRSDTQEKSGLPWIDIEKGQTTSAVLFTFYHALCALGLHAQVMVDQTNDLDNLGDLSQLGTIGSADGCKVTLKSITFEPDNSRSKAGLFYSNGVLNLNNTTAGAHQPYWSTKSGSITSMVLDNGSASGHGTIDETLLDPNTSDFSDLNPTNYDVMTSASYDTEVPGITESANTQTIIAKDGSGNEQFYMLIPYETKDYKLTVEYYITYKTESGYHREAKTGTATIHDLELAAGVKYYLNLVFGLTTFKINVDAIDWDGENINTTVVIETGTAANQSLSKE